MSSNPKSTLVVTGASGQLGRRVVELLLETHKGTIIAATRTPEKLADFSNRGVIVRQADFEDQASLSEAFQGADRLLLISTDALDVPTCGCRESGGWNFCGGCAHNGPAQKWSS